MSDPVNALPDSSELNTQPIWTGMGPSAEMEAINVQDVLLSAGIEAILNGSSALPSLQFEVLVAHENAARARQVLADAIAAGPQAAEEAERAGELQ